MSINLAVTLLSFKIDFYSLIYKMSLCCIGGVGWNKCCMGPSLLSTPHDGSVFPTKVPVSFIFDLLICILLLNYLAIHCLADENSYYRTWTARCSLYVEYYCEYDIVYLLNVGIIPDLQMHSSYDLSTTGLRSLICLS